MELPGHTVIVVPAIGVNGAPKLDVLVTEIEVKLLNAIASDPGLVLFGSIIIVILCVVPTLKFQVYTPATIVDNIPVALVGCTVACVLPTGIVIAGRVIVPD